MEGYNMAELRYQLYEGKTLSDFVLMDFEGEILFYPKEGKEPLIKYYKEKGQVIDLASTIHQKE